jgi:exodeoxyribonuclease III
VGRKAAGEVDGPYSWWSYRGKAFDTDTGWRIDYQLATPDIANTLSDYRIDRAPTYDTRWSDHAPVVATYAL